MKRLIPYLFLLLVACGDAVPARKEVKPFTAFDRNYYEQELRNHFLDEGADIAVKITGDSSDNLQLDYALFDAVWDRKLETSGMYHRWHQMGFKKVILTTNGYRKVAEHDEDLAWMPEGD